MKRALLLLALVGQLAAVAAADPADLANGVFIAHHPPGVQYSQGQDWCQRYENEFAISSCEEQNNRIDLNGNLGQSSLWYVLAAWTEDKEWCGTEFGFGQYDANIYYFVQHGPCSPDGDLEIPTDNWPGPNEGTAITTTGDPWSGNLVPVYYFAGYAYYQGVIPLGADPATGFGGTGNCDAPPSAWSAAQYGGMGLFRKGIYACPGAGGFGPEGPETAVCCLGEECLLTNADECERMGGEFRPEWDTCSPNPCGGLGPEGGDQCGCFERSDDDPLLSQVYCADLGSDNVFFIDPGEDDRLLFEFRNAECTGEITLRVDIFDPPSTEAEYTVPAVFAETPVLVGPFDWSRDRGMARVVLTTEEGAGKKFAFRPAPMQVEGNTDREMFNGDRVARTPCMGIYPWDAHYKLWVPTMAQSMQLKCMVDEEGIFGSEGVDLIDPHGNVVWVDRTPGYTYEWDIPDSCQGGAWELVIYVDEQFPGPGDVCGTLEVAFQATGSEDWWVPEFAFSPVPANPVRAQLAPDDLLDRTDPLSSELVTYYVPYGCARNDYQIEPPVDPSQALVSHHRQWFAFAARGCPGDERTVRIRRFFGDVDVEWYSSTDPSVHHPEFAGDVLLLEVPVAGMLFLRIINDDGKYDVNTDAPFAVCGARPGLRWFKLGESAGASSREYWFYVPPDNEDIEMDLEAWRYCAEQGPEECVRDPFAPGGYFNRAYPETRLLLTDPGGREYEFITNDRGRLSVELIPGEVPLAADEYLSQYRGHLWKLQVTTADDKQQLEVDLVLGDDLGPYATWLEKERFFVPIAFPVSPLMVHEMGAFDFSSRVASQADVYFGHARTCSRDPSSQDWVCTDPVYSAFQTLAAPILPLPPAHKESQSAVLYPWTPWCDVLDSVWAEETDVYALEKPLGLGDDGSIRTTLGGVPGEAEEFISLYNVTGGAPPHVDPNSLGNIRLAATSEVGFHVAGVGWPGGSSPDWIDLAYDRYDLYSSIFIAGQDWFYPQVLEPNWAAFEDSVSLIAEKDPLLYIETVDEPLEGCGVGTDRLYEMQYMTRRIDARHPVVINEEPSLVNAREMRDIVEVWGEDEYTHRAGGQDYEKFFPLCELATRILEVKDRVRPGVGTKIYTLGGFWDRLDEPLYRRYVKAGRDTVGLQGLTCLLLGVDVACLYEKITPAPGDPEAADLDTMNAPLWEGLPSLNEAFDDVRSWLAAHPPCAYDVGFGPVGGEVQECQCEPVIYGHGFWNEQVQEGVVGCWFVFGNLGHEHSRTVLIPWGDLHLYEGIEDPWEVVDFSSSLEPEVVLVVGQFLECTLLPTTWVVGRIVGEADPGAVEDAAPLVGSLSIRPCPNPSRGNTAFSVVVAREASVGISLYSVDGRQVRKIEAPQLGPGVNSVVWDGRSDRGNLVPSGLYWAQAEDTGTGRSTGCWVLRLE